MDNMTTKQIAVAVGKDERTVQRWAKKTSAKMSSVADKMSSAGHGISAEYTLDEVIEIIEDSGSQMPLGFGSSLISP